MVTLTGFMVLFFSLYYAFLQGKLKAFGSQQWLKYGCYILAFRFQGQFFLSDSISEVSQCMGK